MWLKVTSALAGGTISGLLAGGLLGFAGSGASADARSGLGTLLAIGGIFIWLANRAGRAVRPWQRDAETPLAWLSISPYAWSLLHGAALGVGATTRIGYWLWYAVPSAAYLSGSATAGATIYGMYGFSRMLTVAVAAIHAVRQEGDAGHRLFMRHAEASRYMSLALLGVSVTLLTLYNA